MKWTSMWIYHLVAHSDTGSQPSLEHNRVIKENQMNLKEDETVLLKKIILLQVHASVTL